MKIKKTIVASIVFAIACFLTFCTNSVYADASMDYNTCMYQSNYSYLETVAWACSGWSTEGVQHCTAWLGGSDGSNVISATINSLSGSVTAYYWGMCTTRNTGTSALYAENDNGAVATNWTGFSYRGDWGSPVWIATTIDIAKFVSGDGVTTWADGDDQYYARTIVVWRCHAENVYSCASQSQYVELKLRQPSTTFDGKVELSSAPSGATLGSDGKYYVDGDSTSFQFKSYMERNNNGKSDDISNSWWAYQDWSNYDSGSKSFSKKSGWKRVKTNSRTVSLSEGDNTFCEELGFNAKISFSGSASDWTTREACVTIHRYRWDTWNGRVLTDPSGGGDGAALDNDVYYTDTNTANLKFRHQLKRSGGSKQTRYKTVKGTNLSNSFPVQSNYTNSNVSNNNWTTVYSSPSNAASVDVAKDDGSTYCETLYWYEKTREDRGNNDTGTNKIKTEKNTQGCRSFKRYKTTFTATIKVEYSMPDGSWQTIYDADASNIEGNNMKIIEIDGDNIPQDVKIRFTHTITRSGSDAKGSPNKKKVTYSTSIDGTTGYRNVASGSDPHGTAVSNNQTKNLGSGENDSHIDTFTTKIYPEQEIIFCQGLSFGSELQGAEWTASGTAGRKCFKLKKGTTTCMSEDFGIKNSKNVLKMDIYKNGTNVAASGRRETGDTTLTVWAKPNDNIRYKYSLCAMGDLASQFTDKYLTTYTISSSTESSYGVSASGSGYLFGNTVGGADSKGESTEVGRSNSTPGIGPFSGSESHQYETTIYSPSTSEETKSKYSCGSSGNRNYYYRIPGIRPSLDTVSYNQARNNCKSDDYGYVSDVGKTFKQTATWTDIWYENGSAVAGHAGTINATVTGQVRVPYNYKTSVSTTAAGGSVILGQTISVSVQLGIGKRVNNPVNGSSSYSTYTKNTRYNLVQVVIPANSNVKPTDYNNSIKGQEYSITNSNLVNGLNYCTGWNRFQCTVVRSDSGTIYGDRENSEVIDGSNYSITINDDGSNYPIGTKICYIAGVWPSDSHGFSDGSTAITETNQEEALRDTGSRWHISAPTCYTVSKRPSVASVGGDMYAPGGIIGVTSLRYRSNNTKALFGSWSEYGLVAGTSANSSKGKIAGVSSGAGLLGGGDANPTATRECYYSTLTFTNANCGSKTLGYLSVDNTAASYPERMKDQIITRYTDRNNAAAKTDQAVVDNHGGCIYDATQEKYVESYGGASSRFTCLSSGAMYTHLTSNIAYIKQGSFWCSAKGNTQSSRTAIYDADNVLIIGADNYYGSTANIGIGKLGNEGCYKQYYSNLSELPQKIFIAKKIIIKSNVTHISGWLIADEIITCDPYDSDYTRTTVSKTDINSENCKQTLTIDGPVITKTLKLYRTAGSNNKFDNARSGEIFYLGPESYLWAYNQAQRFSQATTTYQRELAPRY